VLLPFARLSELGCLIGLILVWSALKTPLLAGRSVANVDKFRWLAERPALIGLFAVLAAGLVASVDATLPSESLTSSAALIRFAGFCALGAVLSAGQHQRLQLGVALLLMFWIADASVQALTGWSLAGQLSADRLSGIFGADDLKLGPVLAVLSPFIWLAPLPSHVKHQMVLRTSAWVLLALILLLAGSRASWVIFAVINAVLLIRAALSQNLTPVRWGRRVAITGGTAALFFVLAAGLVQTDARLQARLDRTMQLANPGGVDFALAGRVPIWQTAARMSAEHWVNGVGMRGFRYAYPEFAATNDPWVHTNADTGKVQGAFHPHQILLEISAETGLIGLAAWGLVAWLCFALYFRAQAQTRALALPYGLALLGMCFPINTHLAFYSTFWGSLFWWLLALYLGTLSAKRFEPASSNA